MKSSDIKNLLISSLNINVDPEVIFMKLEEEGVTYDFRTDFGNRILDKLFSAGIIINREIEFVKSMHSAFYRISLTGVAAIVVLLISIFLMEGSLSIDSFFGLSDTYDESIVCLLTGN